LSETVTPNALLAPQMLEAPAPPQPPAPISHPGNEGELLAELVRWFESAEDATSSARREAERDRDYFLGFQLSAEEISALEKRGQPPIVINKIRGKVQLMCGLESRARTDPKAMPRTPNEDKRADAATQALRFVADDNDFDNVRSAVYEQMIVEGFAGAEVVVEPGQGMDVEVRIRDVPWDRLFYDPRSYRKDFSDARFLGMVIWQDRDEALEMFPDGAAALDGTFGAEGQASGTYQDKPAHGIFWCDNLKKRVRVVQIFWREAGEWWEATYTKGGFLSPPVQSPYKDRYGKSACRLIMQSAFVTRDNARHGAVRDWISLQDEINKRRSKALHLLSVNRTIAEQGAVVDVDEAKRQAAMPDGYIEVTPGMRYEITPGGDLANGQFQLLQHANAEMGAQGANASLAGKDSRDLSGRAIIAQQAGGQAEIEPLADALRNWTRRIHEAVWMRIRQFWTAERWVRVTDDDGGVQFVGLNRQVTLEQDLMAMPPEARAFAMQRLGIQPGDPRLQQVIRTENDVSDLEVDITIESGPDVPGMQAEQFAQMSQVLPPILPMMPPPQAMEVLAIWMGTSALKDKQKLVEVFNGVAKKLQQPPPPPPPEMQQMQQAKIRQTNAQAAAQEAAAADRQAAAVQKVAQVHDQHVAQQAGLAAQEQMGGYPGQVI